jgi:hypothetical protein
MRARDRAWHCRAGPDDWWLAGHGARHEAEPVTDRVGPTDAIPLAALSFLYGAIRL